MGGGREPGTPAPFLREGCAGSEKAPEASGKQQQQLRVGPSHKLGVKQIKFN